MKRPAYRHIKIEDVNFDDGISSIGGTNTSGFVTASEGRGRSGMEGGSWRSGVSY